MKTKQKKTISAVTFKKWQLFKTKAYLFNYNQQIQATAKKYDVSKNTFSHWVKKKAEIFEAVEGNNAG